MRFCHLRGNPKCCHSLTFEQRRRVYAFRKDRVSNGVAARQPGRDPCRICTRPGATTATQAESTLHEIQLNSGVLAIEFRSGRKRAHVGCRTIWLPSLPHYRELCSVFRSWHTFPEWMTLQGKMLWLIPVGAQNSSSDLA